MRQDVQVSDPTRDPSAGSRARRSRRRSGSDARSPRTRRPSVLTILALATYAVLLSVAIGTATLAIGIRAAGDEPVHWGTFHLTDRDCSPDRSGPSCTWIGTWSPEDGSPPVSDVAYDSGSKDPGDAPEKDVRTGYRRPSCAIE